MHFAQKEPIKTETFLDFWLLGSKFVKFIMSILKQQILHRTSLSWKITPHYLFSSNNIHFSQKEPLKVKICETLESSGQSLSNSSCQFGNKKSVPLKILRHSSMSWKIIPHYIFSSNNIYSARKDPIKLKAFWLSSVLVNFVKSSCQIWKN